MSVCSRNTHGIMVWAWMLWQSHALETRTLLWFGHGCCGERMLSKHERYYGLGMDALVIVCSGNTNVFMVGAGNRMLSKHERYYGLGMDALVIVCSSFSRSCPQHFACAASSATKLACQSRSMASVDQPSGSMARKAALRPKGLRPQTPEIATCAKYCVHQYFCTFSNEKCLKVLRLPAKLQA